MHSPHVTVGCQCYLLSKRCPNIDGVPVIPNGNRLSQLFGRDRDSCISNSPPLKAYIYRHISYSFVSNSTVAICGGTGPTYLTYHCCPGERALLTPLSPSFSPFPLSALFLPPPNFSMVQKKKFTSMVPGYGASIVYGKKRLFFSDRKQYIHSSTIRYNTPHHTHTKAEYKTRLKRLFFGYSRVVGIMS